MSRANTAQVRNPLLALPSVADLQSLPVAAQSALKSVLKEISTDARQRAEKCWRTHKAPMAAYWKAVAVYANHTQRLLKASTTRAAISDEELNSISERITIAQVDELTARLP